MIEEKRLLVGVIVKDEGAAKSAIGANNTLVADVLARLISAAGGLHPESYRKGHKKGFALGRQTGFKEAQSTAASTQNTSITINIEDIRSDEPEHIGFDGLLLDDARLNVTPALVKAFKADAVAKLGEDHLPTDEQWKAIIVAATSAVTIGIAGTGKTFVMMMRAIFLHCYLGIPLQQLKILSVTKDCRLDVIGQLTHLFSLWGVILSNEQALDLVKTPRGLMVSLVRSIAPLQEVVPFELMGVLDQGDEDGRPFDPRLLPDQMDVIEQAYQSAYAQSSSFAESVQKLFLSTLPLPRPNSDNPQFVAYSDKGFAQLRDDEVITRALTGIWHSKGEWPMEGLEPLSTSLDVVGNSVLTNGYVEILGAHIVLGYPKGADRTTMRPGSKTPLYEESLAKRAYLQRYSPVKIIWCDTPGQLNKMLRAAEAMATHAPSFQSRMKGLERPMGIAECLYQTGALIETLGLNPSQAIAKLKFMPQDPDAQFFDCTAKFWPLFETHLLRSTPRMMTFNRLFLMFGVQGNKHLKAVPTEVLMGMRNILTDELQDISFHVGEFIKACMAENRHRIEVDEVSSAAISIFACGDDFQTAHGTQGATPKYLTDFKSHFPSKGFEMNLLGINFRSDQGIIHAAHSLVLGIPAVSKLAPVSVSSKAEHKPVPVYDLNGGTFMSLFDQHYASGAQILILAANPDDYRNSESFINVVLDRDKLENPNQRRVRVRAAQRAKGLEADVVFIVGDFVASTSSWAKNQIFRRAKTIATEDQSPFDVIQQNELYRLAHIALTRARRDVFWLIPREPVDAPARLRASTRIPSATSTFIDYR
ncbi:hypothetical protein [Pseudomonas sp. P9(2020)]|uniref:hypothetical protein n=1 Tax=Pseudomonas sp. P9(2020) TaxID=2763316 RepID=UPI001B344C0A|nr:hypothetical protein [Pseudomonas sp. P9(2020)]MBP5948080.1 hypothetical protein [Pseudomonas sp. P9(2020)]